jgi:hypothetical protein
MHAGEGNNNMSKYCRVDIQFFAQGPKKKKKKKKKAPGRSRQWLNKSTIQHPASDIKIVKKKK